MEWVKYEKPWDDFRNENLNTPGTVVVIRGGEHDAEYELLIGDINEIGGVCDDCKHDALYRRMKPIVVRYLPPSKEGGACAHCECPEAHHPPVGEKP